MSKYHGRPLPHRIKILAALSILWVLILVSAQISLALEFLVNVPKVELREDPEMSANILGQLEKGEEVVSLSRSGEWVKVRTKKRVEGWLEKSSITNAYSYPRALFSVVAVITQDTRTQKILERIPIPASASWLNFNKSPIRAQELGTATRRAFDSMGHSYKNDRYIIGLEQRAVRVIDAAENILDEVILGEIRQRLPFDGNLKEFGYQDDFVKKYQTNAYIERRITNRAEIDSSGQVFLLETSITDYLQFEGGIPDSWQLEGSIRAYNEIEVRSSSGSVLWKKKFDSASANLLDKSGKAKISFESGEEILVDGLGNILKKTK